MKANSLMAFLAFNVKYAFCAALGKMRAFIDSLTQQPQTLDVSHLLYRHLLARLSCTLILRCLNAPLHW